MTPGRTNSYFQACKPGDNGQMSKIRLLIELCRIKGNEHGVGIFVHHKDKILAYFDEQTGELRVRNDFVVVVSHGSANEDVFYDDPSWWNEIEKYRLEIEMLVKNGWKRQSAEVAA